MFCFRWWERSVKLALSASSLPAILRVVLLLFRLALLPFAGAWRSPFEAVGEAITSVGEINPEREEPMNKQEAVAWSGKLSGLAG